MEQLDIPAAIEGARQVVWAHVSGRRRLFINELVRNGLKYCEELSKQDSDMLASIWDFPVPDLNTLMMVAIRHLNGAQIIPELNKVPVLDALAVRSNGIDPKLLHSELVRMKARTGRMKETLVAMLAEVNDFDMAIGLLEVNTRPVA